MALAALATAAAFLFLTPAGCNEVGGVPSWERCTTILGTPAFSVEDLGLDNTFDILPPLIIGVLVGVVAWMAMASNDGS